ncbi:LysR substrate-binding domain-containing protein [Aureimonas sp. ME7]|uniref:LysR substrate-binding domain-containing protein n=1 Tax=Aureimonas sp. ME7 TaxID=2744252 RepID=UPI0015F38288|nr:LysR substrate-binding domain-containing protein [Aureimonas sp. ME7]
MLIGRILSDVDHLVGREAEFDPGSSDRHVRIIAATGLGPFLVPQFVRSLSAAAPGMSLEIAPMPGPAALDALLNSGEADLVLGHRPLEGRDLRAEELMECEVVCMVDRAHPAAGRRAIAMDEYLGFEHLSPNPAHADAASPIDGRLAELGLKRSVRIAVSEYAMVPLILPGSDLVFTSVRPFADFLSRSGDFAVIGAPPEFGPIHFFMLWHERSQHSNFGAWLRRFTREALRQAWAS